MTIEDVTQHAAIRSHVASGESLQWSFWEQWALQSSAPSATLNALRSSGSISHHPELAALIEVPQDPVWHPEGDVWIHTLHVCDQAALIARRDQLGARESIILLLSALCHDLGKPETTEYRDGRWRATGHPQAGVPVSQRFLERIGCPEELVQVILPLVAEHLVHANPATHSRAVKKLLRRLKPATVPQLARLIEADLKGRPPLPGDMPESATRLLDRARELDAEPEPIPESEELPIILGRHLIALGRSPGPEFTPLLATCFEAQKNGIFNNEQGGVEYLKRLLGRDEG